MAAKMIAHHDDLEFGLLPLPGLEHVALEVDLVHGGVHHDALDQEAVLAQPQVVVALRVRLEVDAHQAGGPRLHDSAGGAHHKAIGVCRLRATTIRTQESVSILTWSTCESLV